ncbi:MAG: hypothetical protein WBA91_08795 [Paracoccaceae bacterium]
MKYVQALIALGLFGWASFAVLTGALPDGDGGAGKSRALVALIEKATDQWGTVQTAAGLAMAGLLLALFFLRRSGGETADES